MAYSSFLKTISEVEVDCMAFKVFFSYSHKDEPLLEKLKEHLAPLKNQGLIDSGWHDREISAGTEWEPEIVRHLDTADLILLLVSAAFMNSDYCYEKELQRAIKRHERREARVIPIILSPVDWQIPPLDQLHALPTDGKPVTGAGWHSVDEALYNVVKGIRSVIKSLQKRPHPGFAYQYQMNYISEQVQQGNTAITALSRCDPDLGKLVEWIMNISFYNPISDILQLQLNKLLSEISVISEGDLRIRAEVTADTVGVIADSFNSIVEILSKNISRMRDIAGITITTSGNILKILSEQKAILSELSQTLETSIKSLQDAADSQQTSSQAMLVTDLFKHCTLIERNVNYIDELTHLLRQSVAHFRLPENSLKS